MPSADRITPLVAPLARRLLRGMMTGRQLQFEAQPQTPGRVVFLGDSITHEGVWEGWFPELPTLNRGIGGNAICHVIDRLDSAICEPLAVSLLIGTNDLSGLGRSKDVADIADQFEELVAEITRRAPSALLLVNSVTPRSPLFADRVRSLNERYRRITDAAGATWVDLWPHLATPDGALRPELTRDQLHLTGEGYRVWADVLRPHLARFGATVEQP